MIDIRKLKELVRLMVENDLSELDLKDQEETVAIKRGPTGTTVNHQPVIYQGAGPAMGAIPARHAAPAHDHDSDHASAAAPAAPAAGGGAGDAGLPAIESPMVGTFYSSPNPDAAPFVTVGSAVAPDTVICLIEAMKVFNEIKAERAGTIERVLVNNGDAVEFGQKLFLIKPA
jgi:acetyl-CoA carboxylase biotin carboxyl carrier protein